MNQYNIVGAPKNAENEARISLDEANEIAKMTSEERESAAKELESRIAHEQALLEELRRPHDWDDFQGAQ